MRIVLQRVNYARVTVDDAVCGEIGKGFLIFFGVGKGDTEADCDRLADKVSKLRIFSDENDKINLSLADVDGEILVVSQFTLYADCRKGNRPCFTDAEAPQRAAELYEYFTNACEKRTGKKAAHGIFGADMKVTLENDGPFTVILE